MRTTEVSTVVIPAVIFLCLWLAAMTWIVWDQELGGTVYFWKNLRTEFIRSLPRSYYWTHGWRLICMGLLQAGLAVALIVFIREVLVTAEMVRHTLGLAAMAVMLLALGLQLPRFHPYFRWRVWRQAKSTCRQLAEVIKQFERRPLNDFTDAAEYATSGDWAARHPRGSGPWWPGVVPIAYYRAGEKSCSVIFPLDYGWFIAWRLPNDFAAPGEYLPFEGPMSTGFKLRSIQPLKGCTAWTLLRCEIRFGESDLLNVVDSLPAQ